MANRNPTNSGTWIAAATSLAMIAQQVAGKAARDGLFLSSFGASSLPAVMAGGAVLSVVAIFGLSRLMQRHSPTTMLPILFAANAIGLTVEWAVGAEAPRGAAIGVYLQMALFGPAVITAFWSVINEQFDPHSAKAAVAKIASGGTVGGIVGGLAVWQAATIFQPRTLLLLLAALNGAAVVGSVLIRTRTRAHPNFKDDASDGERVGAIEVLGKAPFLRLLAALVAIGSATSALLDYLFSADAVTHFAKGQELISFFALFWLGVAVLSFLLQVTLGRLTIERLGPAISIAILPTILIFGGLYALLLPGLPSYLTLRGGEAIQRNTIFRSAYELLYTPLSPARKRAAKALIDIGFDRLGTVVGSGLLALALSLDSAHVAQILLTAVVLLGIATLPIARMLHRGYVAALEESLRVGAELLALPSLDAPQKAEERKEATARDALIQRIESLETEGVTLSDSTTMPPQNGAAHRLRSLLVQPDRLLTDARRLLSGDPPVARTVLQDWGEAQAPLASFAILLLADDALHLEATRALRKIADLVAGQLVDVLMDPSADFCVRRRIPRVLSTAVSQRAVDGLVLGLLDERFELRYECGRALLKITDRQKEVTIAQDRVLTAIKLEASKVSADPNEPALDIEADTEADNSGAEQTTVFALLAQDRTARRREHVFTILSLHLDRGPLRLAFRALHQEDARHRGTALEYLEAVLPKDLRDLVWPLLGEVGPGTQPRPSTELLAELAKAMDATGAESATVRNK